MPKVRRDAAQMVRDGFSVTEVGRRFGVGSSTVCKWVKKAERIGKHPIPTRSSRPLHHPKQLKEGLVQKIVSKRRELKRCAEVIHESLKLEGIKVSLSSVKRTLARRGLLNKRSPWKRFHPHIDRPYPLSPGDLVQIDTIHIMTGAKTRIYVFVLIDVYSRWIYAKAYKKMSSQTSVDFVREAQRKSSFKFQMLQSDHGPEFGKHFVSRIQKPHRYTRIGKPNDNAHIERVNRTIQEECLDKVPRNVKSLNKALREYLPYYNQKRLHLGISLRSPVQLLDCVQGID